MATESPLGIIFEMILLVIWGTISTIAAVFVKFFELLASLEFVSGSGALGLFLAISVMAVVTFLFIKFFAKSGKMLIPFFIIGVILLWTLILAVF